MKKIPTILAIAIWVTATVLGHTAQVTVFAAASLTDSLKQIAANYEKSSGDRIVFNFAGSGTLARQIEAGAPADIFISADEIKMDLLAAKGLLVAGSRHPLLSNSLVIITPLGDATIHAPADLTNASVQKIAIGEVKSVPAGTYAQRYLQKLTLWPAVAPKIIPCENVRAVLAAVETGNVDAGIVYKTDAAISHKVKVAFEVPTAEGPAIVYPIALLKDSPQPESADHFVTYLKSEAARSVFVKFGFITER